MNAIVFVVDDEKNILNLFKRILTVEEFQKIRGSDPLSPPISEVNVYTYESAEEALEAAEIATADVIISDLAMSGMDGLEFLRRSRACRPELPFIILTGVGTIDDAVESIKLGAFDFVTKPFQRDEVLLSISKAINFSFIQNENRSLKSKLDQGQDPRSSVVAPETNEERSSVSPSSTEAPTSKPRKFVLSPDQLSWMQDHIRKKKSIREVVDRATKIIERSLIRHMLRESAGNRAEAARKLGISRPAFYKKLKDYGLDR